MRQNEELDIQAVNGIFTIVVRVFSNDSSVFSVTLCFKCIGPARLRSKP